MFPLTFLNVLVLYHLVGKRKAAQPSTQTTATRVVRKKIPPKPLKNVKVVKVTETVATPQLKATRLQTKKAGAALTGVDTNTTPTVTVAKTATNTTRAIAKPQPKVPAKSPLVIKLEKPPASKAPVANKVCKRGSFVIFMTCVKAYFPIESFLVAYFL